MSSRPPKWDWPSHLPKMVQLYNTPQMSIPDIYKAIQCDGFQPCQRSVYAKFKAMGYPTDPVGRNRHLEAQSPANTNTLSADIFTPPSGISSPYTSTNNHSQTQLCTLPEDDMLMDHEGSWEDGAQAHTLSGNTFDIPNTELHMPYNNAQTDPANNQVFDQNTLQQLLDTKSGADHAAWSLQQYNAAQGFGASTTSFESTFDFESAALELNGAEYFGIDTGIHVTPPQENIQEEESEFAGWNVTSPFAPTFDHFNSSSMDLDLPSVQEESSQVPKRAGSFRASIDLRAPFQGVMSSSGSTGTRNRLRSLFRKNSSASVRSSSSLKKYAVSQYTANTFDSGYGSGFGSCLSVDEVRRINSQSLKEFNGLYRVACQHFHEPRGKAQCKDISTCAFCLYSSIHNLGWSARYLKFEVFLSELMLEGVYDFSARDAAGNTALHYAAAGGASFRHLKSLIDAGVDPYAANTAGELFIHCLRPIEPFTLEPNSDCLNSDDLINLLNLLQWNRIFEWRDNDGQTVLHALYSKIAEPQLRATVYSMFINAGYLPTVRDRFGRTAEDVIPLKYDCHGQLIDEQPSLSRRTSGESEAGQEGLTCVDVLTAEWRSQQLSQIKAQQIIVEARRDAKYMDTKTRENALHALSRLKNNNDTLNLGPLTQDCAETAQQNREGNNILLNLTYFITRAVDLNLHDRSGCFPLKAFICNRSLESETGATLSKYVDAILWKDFKARIPNAVNVNMKDREGLTALHFASVRGRPDSVRSLIEAGANANARADDGTSVLQAAFNARDAAVKRGDGIQMHLMKEVVAYLEHAGAQLEPRSMLERGMLKR